MATAKKTRETVVEPLLNCPFKGTEVVIEELPIGLCERPMYRARGSFWVTNWYDNRQVLLHDISHRDGVPPEFPRILRALQSVTEREEPPKTNPAQGLGAEVDGDVVDKVLRNIS